jgi:hypothetical protein
VVAAAPVSPCVTDRENISYTCIVYALSSSHSAGGRVYAGVGVDSGLVSLTVDGTAVGVE